MTPDRFPPPMSAAPMALASEGCADGSSPDLVRRHLRIRLLRDLVSRGLYRVPTEALAERLALVLLE